MIKIIVVASLHGFGVLFGLIFLNVIGLCLVSGKQIDGNF